jgi:hypothetical protein
MDQLFYQGSPHKPGKFAIIRESLLQHGHAYLQLRSRLMKGLMKENFINGAPLATVGFLTAGLT